MVRCRTFNVVAVAFFSNIYWFIWSLSLEVWYPLTRYSLGDQAPIPHNASQGSLDPRKTTFVHHYLSLSLSSSRCPTRLSYYSTILRLPYILGHGPQPNTPTRLIYPHIYYIIKVELRSCGCAKWLHQIVEIFLDLKKKI